MVTDRKPKSASIPIVMAKGYPRGHSEGAKRPRNLMSGEEAARFLAAFEMTKGKV